MNFRLNSKSYNVSLIFKQSSLLKSEVESNLFSGTPPVKLQDQIEKLSKDFSNQLSGFSNSTISILVYEAISDWLMQCLLNFPEEE